MKEKKESGLPAQNTRTAFSVLGLLAYQPSYMTEVADVLRPEMFGSENSWQGRLARRVWESHDRNAPATVQDLSDWIDELYEANGIEKEMQMFSLYGHGYDKGSYAKQALSHPCPPARLAQSAEKLKTAWEAEQLALIYNEAQRIAKKGDPTSARIHVEAQTEILLSATARPEGKQDQLHKSIAHMERYFQTGEGNRVTGVDTGFIHLNRHTNGWQPGGINIIAAQPGKGKTTVSLQSAVAAARLGHPVIYFSCGDMTSEALYMKAACIIADVDANRVTANSVTYAEKAAIARAYEMISEIPFEVIDRREFAGTTGSIRDISRRKAMKWEKTGLILIDYIQQLQARWVIRDPVEKLTQVSSEVKEISVILNCPIIAVSQYSREISKMDNNRRPRNSDLRGSGALEQDADRIFHLDAPGGVYCLHFTKCRHGSLPGNVPKDIAMDWKADVGRYGWIFDNSGTFPTSAPDPVNTPAMAGARSGDDDIPF